MKLQPYLRRDKQQGLTVRPDPSAALRTKGLVEGGTVKPVMVRQGSPEHSRRAHHERLNLKLSRVNSKVQLFKLAALLLFSQSLSAEPPSVQLTTENINKVTAVLNDPTVMSKKMEQKLAGVLPSAVNEANQGGLEDPTQMNRNFREALQGRSTSAAVAAPGSAASSPALPDIKLIASVCGMHKDKNHVMLRINGKTEMVGTGDKITVIQSNQLIEVHVLEIEGGHVEVEVLPAKQTIILR